MPALSLDHWNVYCKDLKATVRFYERYVGLTNGDRPPFNFPGAWLYAGEKPILHLVSETAARITALARSTMSRSTAPTSAAPSTSSRRTRCRSR